MSHVQKIAWLGLGRMGLPMARNLLPQSAPLKVFNRSKERAVELAAAGAVVCASPREAATDSEIVFTMVADDPALEAICDGRDGILSAMRPGSIWIDMSTVSPAISLKLGNAAAAAGIGYICAPVSGSVAMAEAAKLTLLISGPEQDIQRSNGCFARLGAKQFVVGKAHEARFVKLALNLMIGTSAAMLAEALTLSEKAGIDWSIMLDVVTNSAISSPFVQYKAGQLKQRDFTPMFRADQMAKDFRLISDAANDLRVATPVSDKVGAYWDTMMARGLGDLDFIACLRVAEQDAGLP